MDVIYTDEAKGLMDKKERLNTLNQYCKLRNIRLTDLTEQYLLDNWNSESTVERFMPTIAEQILLCYWVRGRELNNEKRKSEIPNEKLAIIEKWINIQEEINKYYKIIWIDWVKASQFGITDPTTLIFSDDKPLSLDDLNEKNKQKWK